MPFNGIPKVYTFPLLDILDGVEAESVATPPVINNLKSAATKFPLFAADG